MGKTDKSQQGISNWVKDSETDLIFIIFKLFFLEVNRICFGKPETFDKTRLTLDIDTKL